MGLILDKMSKPEQASLHYKHAIETCEEDPQSLLIKSNTYKKAATNYAVTLEKLGRRDESISTLSDIRNDFCNEVRVFNNLGIIQKRKGDVKEAEQCYKSAINVEPNSFFPNYNMAIMLAEDSQSAAEALKHFNVALRNARKAKESLYEMNVLLSMAVIEEQSRDYEAAYNSLRQAMVLDPENMKIHSKLGQIEPFVQPNIHPTNPFITARDNDIAARNEIQEESRAQLSRVSLMHAQESFDVLSPQKSKSISKRREQRILAGEKDLLVQSMAIKDEEKKDGAVHSSIH